METRYHLTHANETIGFNEIIAQMIREIQHSQATFLHIM
jgi:hypothetical protein